MYIFSKRQTDKKIRFDKFGKLNLQELHIMESDYIHKVNFDISGETLDI